uniref:WAP domain-containing protein n=1 Tax=Sinocyclocheilus grahami TaxID=75366 RepID=A0A672L3W1_SINGR
MPLNNPPGLLSIVVVVFAEIAPLTFPILVLWLHGSQGSHNGCGHQCMALSKEKPGVCPRRFFGEGLCEELCDNDIDCPNNEKCCRYERFWIDVLPHFRDNIFQLL